MKQILNVQCSGLTGIYYSDDKLLQTRIFSYSDTQRHRLGPNYLLLPVNAPKSAHHNNHHEGFMNFTHRDEEVQPHLIACHLTCRGCREDRVHVRIACSVPNCVHLVNLVVMLQVNYFPSRFDPVRHSERYPIPSGPIGGRREKAIIFKENNFQQPGARLGPCPSGEHIQPLRIAAHCGTLQP
jgi:catalase